MDTKQTERFTTDPSYQALMTYLHACIRQLGIKKTTSLLDAFLNHKHRTIGRPQLQKMVGQFLISECIRQFELREWDFFSSKIKEYREARMICFHLLKVHTKMSYPKMAEDFGMVKRNVMYAATKCSEKLSIAMYYPAFAKKYESIEKEVILFISKLK